MAEVRDFTKYINKNTDEDSNQQEISYTEKIRKHRIAVAVRTVIIMILTVLLVMAIYVSWRDKTYTEVQFSSAIRISDTSGAEAMNLDGYVLQYSKDGVSCLNAQGEALWNQTYQMQNPTVHTCKNVVAVGDYNGHNIYVANTSGILGEIDTNLPIRDFCVASQGVVAAVLDDQTVTWIYLFDAKGETLASFKTTMQDSGYPVDVSISPSGELVCVSYLKADNGRLKTSVAFFNFGAVGQNATDNYASGFDYPGTVVPYVQFMNDSKIFAAADDRIMFFSGSEVPTSQTEAMTGEEEIRSVFYNDSHVGVVFVNNTEEGAYRLQVYGNTGTLETTVYFDLEYVDILFNDDQITIYGEDEFLLCDMNGNVKFGGNFDNAVRVMIPTGIRSKFLLVTRNSIETMELK
ncbi:DUF5711 family protein [Butyrivibrio sp. NC2002]|uniref:DUF5711 family protein n=1 Tax=Butyrivibrio sp. NC2002 TaxID=1410610 RepID=UPI00056B5152|nr:DUF5711 family protein [Butyrivibrio sp. NC2002]